jgi:magnesium transporter
MDIDEAVDLLQQLSDEDIEEIVALISDKELQNEIVTLLYYRDNIAGGIMSTEVFEVLSSDTKESILSKIAENHEDIESINDIFVIDDKSILLGHCTLKELLSHRENVTIQDIMEIEDIKFLPPNTPWKNIALYMSKYNLINVPICDKNRKLLGSVSVDDILPWLLDE